MMDADDSDDDDDETKRIKNKSMSGELRVELNLVNENVFFVRVGEGPE